MVQHHLLQEAVLNTEPVDLVEEVLLAELLLQLQVLLDFVQVWVAQEVTVRRPPLLVDLVVAELMAL